MKLIFCIDDQSGMMFFGKRQSRDSVLYDRILEITKGSKLFMSSYSAKLFEGKDGVIIDDSYAVNAQPEDFCFIENGDFDLDKSDCVILCHWNRRYQADRFFSFDLKALGFKRVSKEELEGSSHKKITVERYERKQI